MQNTLNNAALHNQEGDFRHLVQQTKSRLMNTNAIFFMPTKGKTNSITSIEGFELVETNVRNADKQYADFKLNNRLFRKRQFTLTVPIDEFFDVNELFKDPNSAIVKELQHAMERLIDRVAIEAALGVVKVGNVEDGTSDVTASADGVLEVDATSGVSYDKITKITENFTNNEVDAIGSGAIICATGKENSNLMSEDKFINNDYVNARPVQDGVMKNAGIYSIVLFGGSATGGATVKNPIIPEGATERLCPVLTRDSIAMAAELVKLSTEEMKDKVNSKSVTIVYRINAMRREGKRVQILKTTI